MLTKFEAYLQPYGNGLIEMLSNMFFKYSDLVVKSKTGEIKQNVIKAQNEE